MNETLEQIKKQIEERTNYKATFHEMTDGLLCKVELLDNNFAHTIFSLDAWAYKAFGDKYVERFIEELNENEKIMNRMLKKSKLDDFYKGKKQKVGENGIEYIMYSEDVLLKEDAVNFIKNELHAFKSSVMDNRKVSLHMTPELYQKVTEKRDKDIYICLDGKVLMNGVLLECVNCIERDDVAGVLMISIEGE